MMNKMNFHALENLQVPDTLMERLLSIPEAEEKKPAVIPFWRNRAVIAAASLVLVSILSLTVYFLLGRKNDFSVPIASSSSTTVLPAGTEYSGSVPPTQSTDSTLPTESNSVIERLINDLLPQPSDTGAAAPSATQAASERPTIGSMSETVLPSAPDTTIPTATERPTEQPHPTEEPPEEPIDGPKPTEGSHEPIDPTKAPVPTELSYTDTITTEYYLSDLSDGDVIYCWLYDSRTKYRLFEDEAYSEKFVAEITPIGSGGYVRMTYSPKEHGVVLPYEGHYTYLFALKREGELYTTRLVLGDIYLKN